MKIGKNTTIATIAQALGVDEKRAGWIRRLAIVGTRGWSSEGFEARFPKTAEWMRRCYNEPSGGEIVMSAINEAMGDGAFGVEAVFSRLSCIHPEFTYVNTGDTYNTTVVLWNYGLYITSWGDMVEYL